MTQSESDARRAQHRFACRALTRLASPLFSISHRSTGSTRSIVAASLHIGPRQPVSSIAFTDPGEQADYGEGVIDDDGGTDIPLSAAALRDLHDGPWRVLLDSVGVS